MSLARGEPLSLVGTAATAAAVARKRETLPRQAFDPLFAHARAASACFLFTDSDGRLVHVERQPSEFFARTLLAPLKGDTPVAAEFRARIRALKPDALAQVWDVLPEVSLCVLPFVRRRSVQGALVLATKPNDKPNEVPAVDEAVLSAALARDLSLLAAVLEDRLRCLALQGELDSLSTQLANTYEELALIERVSGGMRVNRRTAEFFRQACLDVLGVINVRAMGVVLNHDRLALEPVLYGQSPALGQEGLTRLSALLQLTLVNRKSCLLVNDVAGDPQFSWLASTARNLIAVPLQRGEEILGCIFGLDKLDSAGAPADFDSVDSKLLTSIANESAVYLENAMLFGDVHDLMMGLLHCLTSAVDAKDAYTCGHSERVALLSRHLASQIRLPDADVDRVYMAGLLHDVGKIGVPESVLQKTGRLTPEEFEQIKKHPQIGARILADVKQLEDIIPGVLYHHERYDGKGYPAGLAGQDIPLMGRIICLADCFDAMTSSRTYRKALPLEVALTEIRRCSGTQFDPALAEAFLAITPDQFRILLRDHQTQAKQLLDLQETLRAA